MSKKRQGLEIKYHRYLGMGLNNYFKVNIVGRNVNKWVIEAIHLSSKDEATICPEELEDTYPYTIILFLNVAKLL